MDDARSKLAGQIEERERALRQDPNDVDNACELVDLYMAADREGDALRLVGTLCRSFPDDPQVCFLQGRIHLSAGRYPNALEAFERAIGLNPQHGGAHFLKAVTLLQMQPPRLETALEEARLAHEYGHPEARDLMRTIEQAQREGRT
jgi:predicted Zn-dependent protease